MTQRALTVTNGTGADFSGAIGGSAPVKSLTITSDQLTAGAITLNGALTATLMVDRVPDWSDCQWCKYGEPC